jgi:pimeloyl-ACP methyl ester carboxylesterase
MYSPCIGKRFRLPLSIALMATWILGSTAYAEECISWRPVLFVHGSGLDSSTWQPMRQGFERAGYPPEWLSAPNLQPDDGSNIEAATRQLAPAIDALITNTAHIARANGCSPPVKIDIVAHSMGAVSARWYVSQVDASRVRNVIGIAPANHGSNALCGLQGKGNREMCPAFAQSLRAQPVQVLLNGTERNPVDETPFGPGQDASSVRSVPPDASRRVNYVTVRLDPDEWIVPARSAILAGAGGLKLHKVANEAEITSPGNVLWHTSVTHDDLPKDEELIAMTIASLQQDSSE